MADGFRTDVYQDHPAPDAPAREQARLDSAADLIIAVATAAELSDEI